MTSSFFKVAYIVLTLVNFIQSVEIDLDNLNFKLKWLTKTSRLPLRIEKRLDSVPFDADFKWYRYSDRQFINEIENYEQSYRYRQTSSQIELDILKYDKHTHEQLSSYLAIPVAYRSGGADPSAPEAKNADFRNDLFTTAFLDRQDIEVVSNLLSSTVDFYCNVSILIPYTDMDLNKINIDLVQKNLDLKVGLIEPESMRLNSISKERSRKVTERKKPSLSDSRFKRSAGKNLIVFLQINENMGPVTISRSELASLSDTRLFCDVDLLEDDGDGGEKKVVHANRVQKEIGQFDLEGSHDNDQDYEFFPNSSSRRQFAAFSFLISITFSILSHSLL